MKAYDFRQKAREALKGHWFIAIIAGFIASFFGGLTFSSGSVSFNSEGSSGSGTVPPSGTYPDGVFEELEQIMSNEAFLAIFGIMMTFIIVASVMAFICLIIGGGIGVGYSRFNIDLVEGRRARLVTVFGGLKQIIPALVARILRSIYVTLWSFLFVIPGIIASYSYSMMHFVMADNPDMSASEALAESKRLMKGNKWRLFCLNLSFIGWDILAIVFTLGIGMLWVTPYREAAFAAFYRDICPKAQIDTDFVDKSQF